MQNPNMPNQQNNYAPQLPYPPNDHHPNDYLPNNQPYPNADQQLIYGQNMNQNPQMYEAPNPALAPTTGGTIPIYNYNQNQPLNTLPLENRPIVVVDDNSRNVLQNNRMVGENRAFFNNRNPFLLDNVSCPSCRKTGCVMVSPEINQCYCIFACIMTILCILFIFLFCSDCAYTTYHRCTNCGHKWKP